ncbi:Jag N-terminal domain-containing protein, partial [Christensenellaceae bacterium OttesenSCG-928-M15]|nr:Jag N-terminal domain-containing protein [Christensenellaceae bacterium OttesenSCG-928-M15]
MKSGEFTGHSIDEAVFHGLQEMGLSIDEVLIETLQTETKGIFGIGAKLAKVRLTERPREEVEAAVQAQKQEQGQRGTHREPRPEYRKDRERNRGGYDRNRNDRGERRERQDHYEPAREQYAYSEELGATHEAAVFLKALLDNMHVSAKVLAVEVEDGVRLRIDSETKGLLIGRRGETLDALQYITSLHVNRTRKQEKYMRVTIDTEDYRSKREDTLTRLARRQAARVKTSGRAIAMEPMNPYERRVLHSSLQGNPYVTTYSEGEEPNRHVV